LTRGMNQPTLFDAAPDTVPSPLCSRIYYDDHRARLRCSRGGRAEFGPEVQHAGCVNRTIRCVTCGATGEQSRRHVELKGRQ